MTTCRPSRGWARRPRPSGCSNSAPGRAGRSGRRGARQGRRCPARASRRCGAQPPAHRVAAGRPAGHRTARPAARAVGPRGGASALRHLAVPRAARAAVRHLDGRRAGGRHRLRGRRAGAGAGRRRRVARRARRRHHPGRACPSGAPGAAAPAPSRAWPSRRRVAPARSSIPPSSPRRTSRRWSPGWPTTTATRRSTTSRGRCSRCTPTAGRLRASQATRRWRPTSRYPASVPSTWAT